MKNSIRDYNKNDCLLLRIILLLGAIISPLATLAWFFSITPIVTGDWLGVIICISYSTLYMLLFTASFFVYFIRKNAYYITYFLYYLSTLTLLYSVSLSGFILQALLIMILFIPSLNMIIKKISHLIWFDICFFILITISVIFKDQIAVPKIYLVFFFFLFYVFNFIVAKWKLDIQNALTKSEQDFKKLVEISPQAIIVCRNDKIHYCNTAAVELAAAADSAGLENHSISDFIKHDMESQRDIPAIQSSTANSSFRETKFFRLDGMPVDVEAGTAQMIVNGKPEILYIIKDISERKAAEKKIHHMAYYDVLTGLPNRYQLSDTLQEQIVGASQSNHKVCILFIDLDRFKVVNDSLGHDNGDILLEQVSERLAKCIRSGDFVSRYGGDEFVIVFRCPVNSDGQPVAQRILNAFRNPFVVNSNEIFITPSIGISIYPDDGMNVTTLIKNADSAMYVAKQKGKNNYRYYSPDINDKLSYRMELENALHKALKNQELVLYYQPQINLRTDRIVGFEALLRWQHPKLGMITPDVFIPIAEETGLIKEIGEWVLNTACAQNKAWQDAGYPCLPVSVNVSQHQLMHSDFIITLQHALMETELSPQYLEVELTESVMQELSNISAALSSMKAIGIRIAIDDFGTGYSSLNMLKNVDIDSLKIDLTFINELTVNPRLEGIVKAIIDMGHSLKLRVIAEGVEQEEQCRILKNYNCDYVQGYYYSRPEPVKNIELMLQKESGK